MQNLSTYEVVIETDGDPIDVEELTEFLYHFRAVYAAGVSGMDQNHEYRTEDEVTTFSESIRANIHTIDWTEISNLAHAELEEYQLGIVDIRRENPLTIVFVGTVAALAVAVILSGGEFKLGPLKVKLPPLGTGIKALRSAFGRSPRPPRKTQTKLPPPTP